MHPKDFSNLIALFAVAILVFAFLSAESYAKKNPSDMGVKFMSYFFGIMALFFSINLLWVIIH